MKKEKNIILDLNLRNAKPQEKDYYINDGNGLYLLVKTTGVKLWRFKYIHPMTKKQKMISLGKYPLVSLADVRIKKKQFLDLLAEKIDPADFENSEKIKKFGNEEHILKNVFEGWLKLQHTKNITKIHLRKVENAFRTYILSNDKLAHKQIKDCIATDFEKLFFSIITDNNKIKDPNLYIKTDLVKRLCSYLNSVFTYAVNKNILEYNKISNLKALLPTHTKKHRPTLPPSELNNILKNINNSNLERATKLLIYFQILTLARPGEAVKAEWKEIDFNQKIWTIEAEKMKMRRDHVVPLSDLAINILQEMKEAEYTNNYIFASSKTKSKHISIETANNALKRLNYKDLICAHGFRALASTFLNESGLFNSDLIEISLAHVDKNTVRATYNNATYLEKRREMLNFWADFVKKSGNINIF